MPKKISNNTVTLFVNGRKYENWLDVSIACTLQSLARTFSVRSTRSKEDLTIGIQPQDEVQIFIDGEPIFRYQARSQLFGLRNQRYDFRRQQDG